MYRCVRVRMCSARPSAVVDGKRSVTVGGKNCGGHQRNSITHHHADVVTLSSRDLFDRVVQHDVQELVKPAERSGHISVPVQLNCHEQTARMRRRIHRGLLESRKSYSGASCPCTCSAGTNDRHWQERDGQQEDDSSRAYFRRSGPAFVDMAISLWLLLR